MKQLLFPDPVYPSSEDSHCQGNLKLLNETLCSVFLFFSFLFLAVRGSALVGECPHWGSANRCKKLVLWMMGYHSLYLRLCHFKGILWKQICSAGSQRIVAQVMITVGLRDYWKVGGKRAFSFIFFPPVGSNGPYQCPVSPSQALRRSAAIREGWIMRGVRKRGEKASITRNGK